VTMPAAKPPDGDDGVQVDLIGADRVEGMTSMEKIRMIIDGVRDGNIVVLEQGLEPDEQSRLIEVTMAEISPDYDEFNGIEIETYPNTGSSDSGFIGRLMGSDSSPPLTVIGPADQIQTLHKDETLISTLVSRK